MSYDIPQEKLQKTLDYIDTYWKKIILLPKKYKTGRHAVNRVLMLIGKTLDRKNPNLIEVPYAAVVPNNNKYKYIFYWDTYFMFRGLLETRHEWVIPSMVENFIWLFKEHHIIPNFSHPESLGRSQPPFLTSMILDSYSVLERNTKLTQKIKQLLRRKENWLASHMAIAKEEYTDVWLSPVGINPTDYNHYVKEFGLSRYGNRDIGYPQPSEQESGWDMTSRFYNRCNDFLAVDLNAYLYKYEVDFAYTASLLGDPSEQKMWLELAAKRQKNMQVFWNDTEGFFYDFDYIHGEQSEFESLAGFTPMWAGIATLNQAKKMVRKLPLFESNYGLFITTKNSLPRKLHVSSLPKAFQRTIEQITDPKQWDYPNIWPPLEYLTVIGLLKYGFLDDATRIIQKSLVSHLGDIDIYGGLLEKIDGLTGKMPPNYWYPTQIGFGWTNAIFFRYTQILKALGSGVLRKTNELDGPQILPFLH